MRNRTSTRTLHPDIILATLALLCGGTAYAASVTVTGGILTDYVDNGITPTHSDTIAANPLNTTQNAANGVASASSTFIF